LGAIEEERLNLDKHSLGYFPKESTAYLLDAHGLEWRNIDHIAVTYDYNFFRPTKHSIDPNTSFRQAYGLPLPSTGIDERYNTERMQTFLEDLAINFGTGHIPPVTYVKHHKTHAASAYHASGFVDPTLVVTIDGQGEDESTTVWVGTDGTLRKISATVPFTHSVGHFYHIVTVLLGYRRNDEGKVMGFAPYGTPQTRQEEAVVDQLRALFADSMWFDRAKGQIQLNSENYEFSTNSIFPGLQFTSPFLRRLFKVIPEQPASHLGRNLSPANRNMAHLAFVAQERVEYVIADMIDYYRNEHSETNGIRHVAIAGGLALNIASNGKLIQQKIVDPDKLFVPAYPADDGTAVGAALSVAAEEYGLNVHRAQSSASYGRTYSPQQIQDVFTKFGLVEGVDYHRLHDDRTLVDVVAKSLAAEGTVAWFQGGSELGPRHLGIEVFFIACIPPTETRRSIGSKDANPGARRHCQSSKKKPPAISMVSLPLPS
jgi:carbamoyltransferase